jgi:hypothetical protein
MEVMSTNNKKSAELRRWPGCGTAVLVFKQEARPSDLGTNEGRHGTTILPRKQGILRKEKQ